jgi:hypothetical protein
LADKGSEQGSTWAQSRAPTVVNTPLADSVKLQMQKVDRYVGPKNFETTMGRLKGVYKGMERIRGGKPIVSFKVCFIPHGSCEGYPDETG